MVHGVMIANDLTLYPEYSEYPAYPAYPEYSEYPAYPAYPEYPKDVKDVKLAFLYSTGDKLLWIFDTLTF